MRFTRWLAVVLPAVLAAGCSPAKQPATATATMLDGQTVTVEQLKGKPLVLNFWATWCPPCRLEMPDLEQVYLDYKDRDVQFLAVSSEGAGDVSAFVEDNNLTLPIATDGRALFDAFGIKYLPTTVFIHSDGTVAEKVVGGREYADFEAAIKKLE